MKTIHLVFATVFVTLALLLSACSGDAPTPTNNPQPSSDSRTSTLPLQASAPTAGWETAPVVDAQGAVVVELTPLNLGAAAADTLDFNVSLNTHSVDLSMDLASAATLSTDTGREADGLAWEAPRGGHHVQGILRFPARVGEVHLLDGDTREITIHIAGLDAPERVFVWRHALSSP